MVEWYCVRDKRKTPNVPGSETTTTTKNGRKLGKAQCAVCGITKTRFLPMGGTAPKTSRKTPKKPTTRKKKTQNQNLKGKGVGSDIADTALDFTLQYGIPYLGKKAFEMGRYGVS